MLYLIKKEKTSKGSWSYLLTPVKAEWKERTINGRTEKRLVSAAKAPALYRAIWPDELELTIGQETPFEVTTTPCLKLDKTPATAKDGTPIMWAW